MDLDSKIRLRQLKRVKLKWKMQSYYHTFFTEAWKVIEPETELEDNWHLEYLCNLLQQETERIAEKRPKEKDTIVNISPRSTKSAILSIYFVPWAWQYVPWLKVLNSSHNMALSIEHCVKSRWLIESDWYQEKWWDRFQMTSDQNVKSDYANNKGGRRQAVSGGGKASGKGADIIFNDDPIDPEDSESDPARKEANDHNRYLYTRINNKRIGCRWLIQQRVHDEDPTGVEMKERPDKYRHICIPAEDGENVSPSELRQFYQGGLFDPKRFTKEILEEARVFLGTRQYNAQFNQRPTPLEGNIFDPKWWKKYKTPPPTYDSQLISVDCSFEEGESNAYTVIQVWGKVGVNAFLIYQYRKQIGFTEMLRAFAMVVGMFPKAHRKIIEKKANGHGLINVMKTKISGIDAKEPEDSKEARAVAVSPVVEAGNVYIPDPDQQPWVLDFINEHAKFPKSDFKDQVDTTTQALEAMFGKASSNLEKLLSRM